MELKNTVNKNENLCSSYPALLAISIPTYNRPRYLEFCIKSICHALDKQGPEAYSKLTVYVLDNSDNHESRVVIENIKDRLLKIRYIKNVTNIGSDRNIAQSYGVSNARYLMVLGDDDFLVPDFFRIIFPMLEKNAADAIFLKAFGVGKEIKSQQARNGNGVAWYKSPEEILYIRNIHLGFISGSILRRSMLESYSREKHLGSNLVQVGVVLHVLSKGRSFAFVKENMVASVSGNTGGYDAINVFLQNFNRLIDDAITDNNWGVDVKRFRLRILHAFLGRSISSASWSSGKALTAEQIGMLDATYDKYIWYRLFYRPLFKLLPRSHVAITTMYLVANLIYEPYRLRDFIHRALGK